MFAYALLGFSIPGQLCILRPILGSKAYLASPDLLPKTMSCVRLQHAQALGYGYGGFMCSALDPEQIGFAGGRTTLSLSARLVAPLAPPAAAPLGSTRADILFFMPACHACAKCPGCMCLHVCVYVSLCVYVYIGIDVCIYTHTARETDREGERQVGKVSLSRSLACALARARTRRVASSLRGGRTGHVTGAAPVLSRHQPPQGMR